MLDFDHRADLSDRNRKGRGLERGRKIALFYGPSRPPWALVPASEVSVAMAAKSAPGAAARARIPSAFSALPHGRSRRR